MTDLFDTEPPAHDPGGKCFRLPPGVTGSAVFGGENDCYRYRLERRWSPQGLTALFIMMNPSTASPMVDDATIKSITRKVMRWEKNGRPFGRLIVCNTFAYRATDQKRLGQVFDPVGPDNDRHIMEAAREADTIVFAYGKPKLKHLRGRGIYVANMLREHGETIQALRLLADGTPEHPLYIPDYIIPMPWTPNIGERIGFDRYTD